MFVLYLIIGALSGTMSGLLGIGGGIVVIPALSALFMRSHDVPPHYVMHLAIGTSLATMIVTSASAFFAHFRRGAVRFDKMQQLLPGLIVGAIVGALIANSLPSHSLRIIFGIFLFFLGLSMFFSKKSEEPKLPLSLFTLTGISGLIGALSSVIGAGGGTMIVPLLLRCQLGIREATGTSVGCGMVIGIIASIMFMVTGTLAKREIAWSTGYIYWPAFLGIAAASILFAPIGTALAYKMPASMLKRIFAIFLVVMAVDILFF